jgi:hypothetical protein
VKIKQPTIYIVLIIIAGAVLRLWGINFGLPYQFHQDEPIIVNHSLAFGSGDLNPHFFIIPPLTSYLLFFFYLLYFVLFNITSPLKGTEAFALSFFQDPTPFYLIGRLVCGFLPSITNIYLAYRLSRQIIGQKAALYAALVMSLSFLNVVNAHYIYTDNLLVCLVLFSLLAVARLMERPVRSNYVLAGLLTGVAIATKYNAAVLAGVVFIIHLAVRKSIKPDFNFLLFLSCVIASFIIFNPFSVIDGKFFLASVTGRIRHGFIGPWHHIRYSLFEGAGPALTIFGIGGVIAAFFKDTRKMLPVVSFILLFYLHLILASQPFPRYVLVLLPLLALGAGYLLSYFGSRTSLILGILLVIPTFVKSLKSDLLFSSPDTRLSAKGWLEDNLPAGTKIVLDSTFFRPPINQSLAQIEQKKEIAGRQPELSSLKLKKINYQLKSVGKIKTYELFYLIEGSENSGQFLSFWPVIATDLSDLEKTGIEYIVFNNMTASERMIRFRQEVAAKFRPVAEFNPYYQEGFRRPWDTIETTALPVGSKELFSRRSAGPYLVIYKIR